MNYLDKLYARVGSKGELAFVRFHNHNGRPEMLEFKIVWSDNRDRLPRGETGYVHKIDVASMIEDGTLHEVSESTIPCPEASA